MTRASGSAHTRVRVKICGVTNWADARLAVDLGADALGFNFYPPSPRSVSPGRAWEIIRRLPPAVSVVGVFVNWPAEAVAALARALHLGAVQLHGDETVEEVRALAERFSVIKAFGVRPGFRLADFAALWRGVGVSARWVSRGFAWRHRQDGGLAFGSARESLWTRDFGGRDPAG